MVSSYLKNVSAQLKNYSATLDKTNILADKPWALIDEQMEVQKLIFKRNNELILSKNGNVQVGSWEYFPEAKSLLIDRGNSKILCNEAFIDNGVMVLKLDGLENNFFLFANENIIPDLDAVNYLKRLRIARLNLLEKKLQDGRILEVHRHEWDLNKERIGNKVTIDADDIPDGIYELTDNREVIVTENSQIVDIYYKMNYIDTTGKEIIILQHDPYNGRIKQGDFLIVDGILAGDCVYNFSRRRQLRVSEGKIVRLEWKNKLLRFFGNLAS